MNPPIRVTVTDIGEDGYALVRDTLGHDRKVTVRIVRTGMTPAKGELWLIDNTMGTWSFAAKIGEAGGGGGGGLWVGPEAPLDGSVFWYDTDAVG